MKTDRTMYNERLRCEDPWDLYKKNPKKILIPPWQSIDL